MYTVMSISMPYKMRGYDQLKTSAATEISKLHTMVGATANYY